MTDEVSKHCRNFIFHPPFLGDSAPWCWSMAFLPLPSDLQLSLSHLHCFVSATNLQKLSSRDPLNGYIVLGFR